MIPNNAHEPKAQKRYWNWIKTNREVLMTHVIEYASSKWFRFLSTHEQRFTCNGLNEKNYNEIDNSFKWTLRIPYIVKNIETWKAQQTARPTATYAYHRSWFNLWLSISLKSLLLHCLCLRADKHKGKEAKFTWEKRRRLQLPRASTREGALFKHALMKRFHLAIFRRPKPIGELQYRWWNDCRPASTAPRNITYSINTCDG